MAIKNCCVTPSYKLFWHKIESPILKRIQEIMSFAKTTRCNNMIIVAV